MNKTKIALFLVIILGIGLFLRLYNLNKHDFWYDEALSLVTARYITPQNIIKHAKLSSGWDLPFFAMVYLLIHVFTDDSFFRFLPLIFGILSIVLIYLIGKRLFDSETGLISAFLLAISPFHVYYSQELRSYSLLALSSLLSAYFFVRILTEKRIFLWVCFIFSNILCLYSHYCAVFFLFSENIYFFISENRPAADGAGKKLLFKWIVSQSVILLCYIPLVIFFLINALINFQVLSTFNWVPRPSIQMVIQTFNIFNLGYNGTEELYIFGGGIFFPLFFLGVWKAVKEKRNIYLLLCWLFMPVIAVILISIIPKQSSIYIHRVFIYILPAYYIIIANGLRSIKNFRFFLIVGFFIIALVIVSLRNYYSDVFPQSGTTYLTGVHIKKEYKLAANYIKNYFQKADIIVHTSRSSVFPFIYYHNNEMEEKWVAFKQHSEAIWWDSLFKRYPYLSELSLSKSFIVTDIKKVIRNHRRIWLVYSGWDLYDRESAEIKKWLDRNFRLMKKSNFKGIDIYLYGLKNNSQNKNNTGPTSRVNITGSQQ